MRVAILVDSYSPQDFFERQAEGLKADIVSVYRNSSVTRESMLNSGRAYTLHLVSRRPERFVRKAVRRLKETVSDMRVRQWPAEMETFFDRYVQERKPDVVLAEFAPNALQALDGCRRHGIPLVTHFHGYDASSMLRHKGYVSQLPGLFRESAAVVAVSRHMASTLTTLGCPREKLSIIPCGAPVELIAPRIAGQAEEFRFITVGRMIPLKGPLLAIKAFAHCHASVKRTCLTMIGDGPLLRHARRLAVRLGVERQVVFLGVQPFAVVARELRRSDVFLQHSVTTRLGHVEGWGVASAEAQAAGLPVIATDHGGLPDQIIDGETGYLIAEGDWRTMGARMIELARNPELRERMGTMARAHIEEIADTRKQVEKLRLVLERACAANGDS